MLLTVAMLAGWAFLNARTAPPPAVQRLFDQLYDVNGITRVKKPALSMSSENVKVAAYYPSKNIVYLDEKAWDICRSMGRDSLAALAFIFGHELAHAFQTDIRDRHLKTNFLAYDRNFSGDIRTEKTADVQGVFNAWLAGYDVVKVMPVILDKIYDAYGLKGKNLPGYPSLDERQKSCAEVQKLAENLLDLFESANYLMSIGQPNLAITSYEHILQWYQGREVWNNLGIASCLAAQAYWVPDADKFVYPLEADWAGKLAQAAARGEQSGGGDALLQPLRKALLDRADEAFTEAGKADPGYLTAAINRVSVLNMLGKPTQALIFFDKNVRPAISKKKMRYSPERQMAQVAEAITYAMLPGRMSDATTLLQSVAASGLPVPALYAQLNFDCLTGQSNPPERNLPDYALPENFRQTVAMLKFDGMDGMEKITVNQPDGLFFSKKRAMDSGTFVFSNQKGNLVSMLRFQNRNAKTLSLLKPGDRFQPSAFPNILPARGGFYIHSPRDRVIIKTDAEGRVLEMVKYILN